MTDTNTIDVNISDANVTDVNAADVNVTDVNVTNVNAAVDETEKEKTIDSVETRGNVYISNEKIFSTARSRAGQLFSVSEAEEDAKRIAELRGVEFAYYSVEPVGEKVKLIFVVKEKTVIRQITFSGDKKYDDKKLIDQLGFSRGDYLDKFTAKAGAEKLTEFYHKSGYPLVKVDFDDSGIEKGQLHYTVSSGQRVKIKKVGFKGNTAIKSRELKNVIKSKPRNLGVFQNYFKQDVLDDDIVALQKAYDRRGFLDTKIAAKTNYINNNKGVEIVYAIEEGKQYDVEKIELAGNEFFGDANLTGTFRLKVGKFYSNEKAEFDRDEIIRIYKEAGFINVDVESVRHFTPNNKIIAHFDIKEDGRFSIGKVNISGNKTVQDKVVRRVLDEKEFKPGEWYNADIARGTGEGQLEKDIKTNVYTESATITPVDVNEPNKRDAEVRIKEGKTGSIMFGAGVSSNDGLIGQIIYEQRNFDIKKWPKDWRKFFSEDAFKGAGQRLRIELEPGTQVSRFSISWTEPYLKDKPISMTLAGSVWERQRESYDEQREKASLGFIHRLKNGWYRTLALRFENVAVKSVKDDAPKEVKDVKGNNLLAGVKLGFGRDTTDSRFSPTKGVNYELNYEQVTGSHNFGIVDGTFRWYKTLHEDIARRKTVLETKLFAGSTVGDAPVFEKFYAGGIGSIRGFKYRGISPRGGGDRDPIGSRWLATASGEVSVPLTSEALSALFFVDTGMIESGGIRASAGIGIQIMIPQWFGPVPMRFELAAPFFKSSEDETQIFSFSVGALF
ncbi:MAG: BamA/TamA family outer membrane protein [Sedimentisphaerales bacterium]